MNNVMVLHIHKHLTDTVNLKDTLNEFVTASDERLNNLDYEWTILTVIDNYIILWNDYI